MKTTSSNNFYPPKKKNLPRTEIKKHSPKEDAAVLVWRKPVRDHNTDMNFVYVPRVWKLSLL